MWKNIRGLGHAYSYSIIPRPNEGLLLLTFYRSVNVPAAYKEAKNIIVRLIQHNTYLKYSREYTHIVFLTTH